MEIVHDALIDRHRHTQALANLIGESPIFREAIAGVTVAAKSDAAVLITGETGTGKELIAHAIHYLSSRAAGPFIAVNCGSLTDTLLEDELFGHERGAFTDAQQRRLGLLGQADGGTLLLDEIDALTPRGQVALLRVLQDKVFRPLGAQRGYRADVRFIASTNAPLPTMMDTGAFRPDLYYRLCVFGIELPPLRERRMDILPLAAHFLKRHAVDVEAVPSLSMEAQAALTAFAWPGNVRELENVMIRSARMCKNGVVDFGDLALGAGARRRADDAALSACGHGTYRAQKSEVICAFERDYLTRIMRQTGGNITRAAKLAGKERRDFSKLLKKHSVRAFSPTTG